MPYQGPTKDIKTTPCPVCGSSANKVFEDIFVGTSYDCIRCGDFTVTSEAINEFGLTLTDAKRKALASYVIRKMQSSTRPDLRTDFFRSLMARSLPTPDEATDNLLRYASEQADGRPGIAIELTTIDEPLPAIIGVVDDRDVRWVIDNLVALRFVSLVTQPAGYTHVVKLTGSGWRRIEELRNAHVASHYAFFARRFRNPELDLVVDNCLVDAVLKTGFEMRMATQRAGLIDAVIEDEIRRCRFLVADLSDDNAGAYWEAGFAEGLGKPVIYLCREYDESDPDKEKQTHFDTNHRHTVRWNPNPETFSATATRLKAAIRNTLLGDAKQND
jgi:hypothetical protein